MKRFAFPLMFAILLAACGGGDDDSGSADVVALPEGTASAEDAADVVGSFDSGDEQAIARLNDLVYQGGDDVAPALAPMLGDDDPDKRWAALYVMGALTDTEQEIALLEPMLADEDPILRVMAAGTLAGVGVSDALPLLIEGLSSEADVPFSDPPRPIAAQAQFALEELTGDSFETAEEWQSWWDDVQGSIQFEDGVYVTG
jgi:hypothetical protein